MQFKKLHQGFILPTKGSIHAGGLDLYMPEDGSVGHTPVVIPLGFAAAVPEGYVALLLPRSSAGSKGLELTNTCGVIDSDYRGEWKAVLRSKYETIHWKAGDRLLQCVVVPVANVQPELVEELETTERGSGGFGSSGK